jgi:hypothetical protein
VGATTVVGEAAAVVRVVVAVGVIAVVVGAATGIGAVAAVGATAVAVGRYGVAVPVLDTGAAVLPAVLGESVQPVIVAALITQRKKVLFIPFQIILLLQRPAFTTIKEMPISISQQ